jgi:Mg-chelatase subunit ChlD
MPSVDERIVAEEKAAVRAMVNAVTAKDLQRAVDLTLTRHRAADGYTYFKVAVKPTAALPVVPKDVVILIDASGSIGNDRLTSCRKAAQQILRTCTNTGDRFNLVAFRDRFSYAFKSWRPCDAESFDTGDRWLKRLAAHGRTDVFATIASVLTLPRDPARPLVALIVTDGVANEGVRGTEQIISRFSHLNDGLVSVYMYGVKSRANRELIDVLTRANRGESFIYDGWRWSAGSGIGVFSERFRDPVLTDLRVIFPSACPAVAYPALLKNIYRGNSVEIVGRVPSATREVAFSLKGLSGRVAYEGFFRCSIDSAGEDPSLPAAWAAEEAIARRLATP